MTVDLDVNGLQRLLSTLLALIGGTIGATFATFRIVAMLIVGRRLLNAIAFVFKDIILNLPIDYLTGYYLRKTFTRLERAYLRYYELPSALRAIARTGSQICILFLVEEVVDFIFFVFLFFFWDFSLFGVSCWEKAAKSRPKSVNIRQKGGFSAKSR